MIRFVCRMLAALLIALPAIAQRMTLALDGEWEMADSRGGDTIPNEFSHTAPVPGLANLAKPPFPDVDRFDSRELLSNLVRRGMLPKSRLTRQTGVPHQNRNYFWYRRNFRAPREMQRATLRIAKAQFGTAVWLNGAKLGEHLGCFTAGYFDLGKVIRWDAENTLVIRIGAHPAALPAWVPAGTDFEKRKWTPGIYDRVSVILSNNPVIESVQVAPSIDPPAIVVRTRVRNTAGATRFTLRQRIHPWRDARELTAAEPMDLRFAPGEERLVTQTIPLPGARLWTPETPNLYMIETTTGGDRATTRFGVREFRFDTATRRAYLNGKVYFLRGSNITLHRFFEDPDCGGLPWNEQWVRKLLVEIPKRLHWNSFRFCIGPVPEQWLDIADEAGLLIQNEFFIWTGNKGFHQEWSEAELLTEYSEWVRDNRNHPSVAIWDASNETRAPVLREKIIPAVRRLDLSNRPWENGYNLPAGPDDPVEDHPYLFPAVQYDRTPGFRMEDLEKRTGCKSTNSAHPTSHAVILNEYGWLWLLRDGSPTVLTGKVYAKIAGERATAEERFEAGAYYLAGLTEYWRAHRNFAGVLHFVYLTASYPGAFTSDHFQDVRSLELEPHFVDYMTEAFRPLGVYLNFWRPTVKLASEQQFAVMMVNDEYRTRHGRLVISLSDAGKEVSRQERPFTVAPLGENTIAFRLRMPKESGDYVLRAIARTESGEPTVSRRKVHVAAE